MVVAKKKHCIETAKKAFCLIHMQGDAEEAVKVLSSLQERGKELEEASEESTR